MSEASAGEVVVLDIHQLQGTFTPREATDPEHTRLLAECVDDLPPLLVHAATMRVIDGMHRLLAARSVGRQEVRVRLFEGTEQEAFQQAVLSNITHGLPLTLDERRRSAARMLRSSPDWSDRRVAESCGLSPKTVAVVRVRTEDVPHSESRVGRDGRRRALPTGRIRFHPHEEVPAGGPQRAWNDDALRSAAAGADLVQWLERTEVDEWHEHVGDVPLSRVYFIAEEARRRSAEWKAFADALEHRATRRS